MCRCGYTGYTVDVGNGVLTAHCVLLCIIHSRILDVTMVKAASVSDTDSAEHCYSLVSQLEILGSCSVSVAMQAMQNNLSCLQAISAMCSQALMQHFVLNRSQTNIMV